MVRALLFDDIREQRFQDLVFSNLRSMLKARLIAKRPMNYVDATNLTPQERQHWIKLARIINTKSTPSSSTFHSRSASSATSAATASSPRT